MQLNFVPPTPFYFPFINVLSDAAIQHWNVDLLCNVLTEHPSAFSVIFQVIKKPHVLAQNVYP